MARTGILARGFGSLGITLTIAAGCGGVSSDDDAAPPDAAPVVEPNLVFATTTTHAADFGSVEFADITCNAAAQSENLPGEYVAWLSSGDSDARTRVGDASGWVRVDGKPFAQSLADLENGKIYYPVELAADGTTTRGSFSAYWTASDPRGEVVTNNCANWTSTSPGDSGTFGVGLGGAVVFTQAGNFGCEREARFLCLGVDRQATIEPPAETGRIAFLSATTVAGDAGRAALNLVCQNEAGGAGLTGTFVAGVDGLATQANLGGPAWVRPDGTPVTSVENPLTADGFVSPISQTADGSTYLSTGAWTGVGDSYATAGENCTDWSAVAGMGSVASTANASSAGAELRSCDSVLNLFCFEL